MITRVAPAVLALLGDGMPRSRRAIVAALAERHPKDEVARTLMRLAVTGRPSFQLPTSFVRAVGEVAA